jgi:hypothetical protein
MPVDKKKYPWNWREFSAVIRFLRAGGRCECSGECGLHRTTGGPRRCVEVHGEAAKFARGTIRLTTAHLCKCDPLCAEAAHVKAMCQRCHLRVDVGLHRRGREKNQLDFWTRDDEKKV